MGIPIKAEQRGSRFLMKLVQLRGGERESVARWLVEGMFPVRGYTDAHSVAMAEVGETGRDDSRFMKNPDEADLP